MRSIYNLTQNSLWIQVTNKGASNVIIAVLDIVECYPEITNTTMKLILKTAIAQHVIYYVNRDALNMMYSLVNNVIYKYAHGLI
jgi:hypothetical protein